MSTNMNVLTWSRPWQEFTNYHFDCKPDALRGALERFSQFFIAPLCKADALEREVNAVDNEFSGGEPTPPAALPGRAGPSATSGPRLLRWAHSSHCNVYLLLACHGSSCYMPPVRAACLLGRTEQCMQPVGTLGLSLAPARAGVQQDDSSRLAQLRCHTARPGHIYRKFTWGNRRSLVTLPAERGVDVRERLVQYYRWGGLQALVMRLQQPHVQSHGIAPLDEDCTRRMPEGTCLHAGTA